MELICYLSNGYPTIAESIVIADIYAQAGCDAIEVDFPGRNPYLESEYIAGRMARALENCGDYDAYMEGIAKIKAKQPALHFIQLLYEDTLREIGYERFLEFCEKNELRDLILVGQKDDHINKRLMKDAIRVSCYVRFELKHEEVEQAKNSNGFVYMQAKPAAGKTNEGSLKDRIAYLRRQGISRPVYCGVGIHSPEDVTMAKEAGADGIFVGSSILKLHHDHDALIRTIRDFKARC
ncbi:MAG: tryptophan synthase subunit alpha [Spirochaetaceae bacterium]|jgi:tryptophan synthase alpha chain|nr:tryptophan synthase subunit alpha [Spirochaetaceae bacterium]